MGKSRGLYISYVWRHEPRPHSLTHQRALTRLFEEYKFYCNWNASSSCAKSSSARRSAIVCFGTLSCSCRSGSRDQTSRDYAVGHSGSSGSARPGDVKYTGLYKVGPLSHVCLTHTLTHARPPNTLRGISAIAFKEQGERMQGPTSGNANVFMFRRLCQR